MEEEILKVVFTKKSKSDLEKIYHHYALNVSVDVAEQILKTLLFYVQYLEDGYLYMGQREPYLAHLKREYRRLVADNYKIIYSVGKKAVYIHCFFDARQNPKKMKVR